MKFNKYLTNDDCDILVKILREADSRVYTKENYDQELSSPFTENVSYYQRFNSMSLHPGKCRLPLSESTSASFEVNYRNHTYGKRELSSPSSGDRTHEFCPSSNRDLKYWFGPHYCLSPEFFKHEIIRMKSILLYFTEARDEIVNTRKTRLQKMANKISLE